MHSPERIGGAVPSTTFRRMRCATRSVPGIFPAVSESMLVADTRVPSVRTAAGTTVHAVALFGLVLEHTCNFSHGTARESASGIPKSVPQVVPKYARNPERSGGQDKGLEPGMNDVLEMTDERLEPAGRAIELPPLYERETRYE
jgi:hypothetical protein